MGHNWTKNWFSFQFDHVYMAYLPNKDRNQIEFDVEPWETEAFKLQGKLFGGATSYPTRGSYREIEQSGSITDGVMVERTRLITSFVAEKDLTENALKRCSDFLKKFKHMTNQESVVFVLDGEMFYL